MSHRSILPIACLLLALVSVGAPAADETTPPSASPNGNEMPLDLYRRLKEHFDALYGAPNLLLPAGPNDKKDAEAALRKDAAEHKAVLVKALKSSQTVQREIAARALEYSDDKKAAVGALKDVVNADAQESVRRAAAAALAKLPDADAVDALVKALSDSADAVRGLSATALGSIKDSRATQPLLDLLRNESKPLVRMQAANALSKIKDPAAAEQLAKLMDAEKDERVKMALAGAVRNIIGGDTEQTAPVPQSGDAAGELAAIQKEMKEVEEKLRGDRHDQSVQALGGGIEKKLAMLIEKLDKDCNCNGGGQGSGQKPKPGSGSGSAQNGSQQQQRNLRNQGSGSPPPPAGGQSGTVAQVTGKQDAWSKLPPAQRDELLQAYRDDVPERWRKRLEAYFLSIAAEEAKDADK